MEKEADSKVELKISNDQGGTWQRRKIDMSGDLDESGLNEGEIFQHQGEQYEVFAGDDGLSVKKIKKSVGRKK